MPASFRRWTPLAALVGLTTTAVAAPPSALQDRVLSIDTTLHETINTRLQLASSRIVTLEVPDTPGVAFTTQIPIDGQVHTVDLVPHSVRSADYRLLVQTADGGYVDAEPGAERTFRGTVRGMPGSRVAGSLLGDGLHAMVRLPDDTRHWIEPAAGAVSGADPSAYVLYTDEDVLSSGSCGNDTGIEPGIEPAGGGVAGAGECIYVTELACDSDHEYYLDHNSSAQEVEDEITAIINTMNDQYESQVQITHEITVIVVRPFPNDPYASNVPSSLLGQFRDHWLQELPDVTRDVAQLFTGRDLQGNVIGIALTLGGICTENGYCLSQDIGGFGCRTDLSAHELGHLWAAFHCSCSNPAFTMNPSLTCANVFSQSSINSITNHRNSRQCLSNPCIPDNDFCSSFEFIEAGQISFSTSGASTDGPPGLACGNILDDVWFWYIAPCDGQATLDLCGSSFDSTVAIYSQFALPDERQLDVCSDNGGCGGQASATFDVTEGGYYAIQIGSTTGDTGDGILTLTGPECVVGPSNDNCGNPMSVEEGQTDFTTDLASTDGPGEACLDPIENDVWFRFQPLCDDLVTVSLCGSDFDTRLAVYEGTCPGESGLAIACSDDSDCGGPSEVQFLASAGVVYRIRVGGAGGQTGNGTMNVTCGAQAPCPWDGNGDGFVNVDDLVNLIVAWGVCPGCAEDVNGDDEVNVDDLVELIVNWGPCP